MAIPVDHLLSKASGRMVSLSALVTGGRSQVDLVGGSVPAER